MERDGPTQDGFDDKVKRGLYIPACFGFTRNLVLNDTRILGINLHRVRNQFPRAPCVGQW